MSSAAICSLFLIAVLAILSQTNASNVHEIVPIPTSIAAAVPASKSYSRVVQINKDFILTPIRGVYLTNNTLVSGGVSAEAVKAMSNVKALLNEAGCNLSDIYKFGVRLTNLNDLSAVQVAVYNAFDAANKDPVFAGSVDVHSALISNAKVELAVEAGNC